MITKKSAILLVLDGVGDRPVESLGGKTPLQVAATPNLDRLAREGQNGLLNVIGPGFTPGSDTAHLALFGYDPADDYPGRGPLEALGAGLDSKPGDVAFRANFATVDENMIVLDRRAGRQFTHEEGRALQDAINGMKIEDVTIHFIHTVEHRGAVILRGPDLSDGIGDIDPHETGKCILRCEGATEADQKIARIVNEFVKVSHEVLKNLEVNKKRIERGLFPANALLLRGPGQHRKIATIKSKFGIRGAVIAGGALYIGAAKYVGMEHLPVEGQTGTIDTNFDGIAATTINAVKAGYEYVFVHIKATDNASHDSNPEEKVRAIELADTMIGRIITTVGNRAVVAVTGDHTTPVSVGEHTCDPVPIILWADFIRPDFVKQYSEFDAAEGALHSLLGKDVMPLLLGYAGHIEKFGA